MPPRPHPCVTQGDGTWLAGIGVAAALICAITFSAQLGLGDAPESAAGAQTWSVLHAPGYPLYVSSAGVFTRLLPFLSVDAALNLFSSLVTIGTSALLFLTARRLQASRPAAATAALGWMSAASVWFYASYAKHDALTSAWWAMILAIVLATPEDGPSDRRCALVGVLLGLSLGLGWAPIASGAAAVLWWARRRGHSIRTLATLFLGVLCGAATIAALVVTMTAHSPHTSWGGVRDIGSLVRLWTMDDFGFAGKISGSAGATSTQTSVDRPAPLNLVHYGAVVARDLGPALALLGLTGMVLWWWARRPVATVLALAVGGNLVVVSAGLSVTVWGFRSGIVQGGFLAPTLFGVSLAAARALDTLVAWLGRWSPRRLSWAILLVVVVGTSVVTHRPAATQLRAPVTRAYASQVLQPLPPDAVLLAGTASSAFPLFAAQAEGLRRDVVVIMLDGLSASWYREQLDERQGILAVDVTGLDGSQAVEAILSSDLPVHLDHRAQVALAPQVAYRPSGLTAEILPDQPPGYIPHPDPRRLVGQIRRAAAVISTDPARTRWPNDDITRAYAQPLLLVAQQAINDQDWDLAREALRIAAQIEPDRGIITETLEQLPR